MSEFGGLIRDAREKLGLSPHRVAELIGRGTGIVKAWERGRAVPTDPFVITSLAAVLAIDETRLYRAAGMEMPDRQPTRTIEQELATIAPPRSPAPAGPSDQGTKTAPVDVSRGVITEENPTMSAPEQTSAVTAPVRKQPAPPPTVPTETRRSHPRPRVAVVPPQPEQMATQSYMDDPEERWSYRLRAVWTAAGLGGLAVLLVWAGSRALEALGDAWDALLSGL